MHLISEEQVMAGEDTINMETMTEEACDRAPTPTDCNEWTERPLPELDRNSSQFDDFKEKYVKDYPALHPGNSSVFEVGREKVTSFSCFAISLTGSIIFL
jgi:hypothetical protein